MPSKYEKRIKAFNQRIERNFKLEMLAWLNKVNLSLELISKSDGSVVATCFPPDKVEPENANMDTSFKRDFCDTAYGVIAEYKHERELLK